MTQYQIECRSRGQSMANFRFFSLGGRNHFTASHSFFVCALHETYKKIGKKVKNHSFFDLLNFSLKWPEADSVRLFYRFLEGQLKHLEAR